MDAIREAGYPLSFSIQRSHTSVLTLFIPIFIPVAQALNLDPTIMVFSMTMFTNALTTMLGKASYSMTMAEGYAFKDYVKVGFPLNVESFIIIALVSIMRFNGLF